MKVFTGPVELKSDLRSNIGITLELFNKKGGRVDLHFDLDAVHALADYFGVHKDDYSPDKRWLLTHPEVEKKLRELVFGNLKKATLSIAVE